MRLRSFLALALVASLTVDPAVLLAEGPGTRVFVYYADPSDKDYADQVAAQLQRDGVDAIERTSTAGEASSDEALAAKGSDLLKEAKKLYTDLQFQAAFAALKQVRRNADASTLRGSFFLEALIHQASGDFKGMNKAMENYAVMGGTQPDESYFAPTVIKKFNEARRKVAAFPVATLDIRPQIASGLKAEVFLDGNRLGWTPLRITNGYRVGPHLVKISAQGYKTFQRFVVLDPKGLVLNPALEPLAPAALVALGLSLSSSQESRQILAWVQASTSSQGIVSIDLQGLLRIFKGGILVGSAPLIPDVPVAQVSSARIREALFGLPVAKTTPAAIPKVDETALKAAEASSKRETTLGLAPAHSTSQSWYQKWWVWTLVGAAAAAGGATYFATKSSGSSDTVHVTVGTK